jgi:murein DD-endopeptidase MepM/ murein hydrolase activator NlpD
MHIRIDGLVLVAIGLVVVMAASLFSDHSGSAAAPADSSSSLQTSETSPAVSPTSDPMLDASAAPAVVPDDPGAFEAPYDEYTVTQGPHGEWYGHLAIDIAAGKDTPIKSPIRGTVTDLFIDQWGNPNLVIENDVYRVSLLHGNYSVAVNTPVEMGQIVGNESNIGYTTDWQGNPCAGRDCGYHTHLNVFDKRLGENVNPLDLINSAP